jgi:phosphate transport system permease protein
MSVDVMEIKPPAPAPRPMPKLEHSLTQWRNFFSGMMTTLCVLASLIAMAPLFAVLYMLIKNGLNSLSVTVFTTVPPPFGEGFGNALLGTAVTVSIAGLLSIPFGIMVGIYLSEFGEKARGTPFIRFALKVMTGVPSILAGVFAYALVVLTRTPPAYSAIAGGVALAVLMLPIVALTAEEAFKQVPQKMREAAFGMGCTRTQVVTKIVVPTALPGVLTGVMLSIARACGETAPLLFTAKFAMQWFDGDVTQPIASLSVFIFNATNHQSPSYRELAWTASLVLVVMVLSINLLAQYLMRGSQQHKR